MVYVSFLKGANDEDIDKAGMYIRIYLFVFCLKFLLGLIFYLVRSVLNVRLVEPAEASASESTTVASRSGALQNVIDARVSLMILPQATLAGRVPLGSGSGASAGLVQYHSLVDKSTGSALYDRFYEALRSAIEGRELATSASAASSSSQPETRPSDDAASALDSLRLNNENSGAATNNDRPVVKRGLYGARQILSLNTKGPYTHFLEI